jgi:hypothetical protein
VGMADSDTSELIEQWARRALKAAEIELPDDASVSAEAGGDGASSSEGQRADGYRLSVNLPKGEGEQQTASSIQAALSQAVEDDPTLGGLFEKVAVSPAGVDLVGTSEAGVRSMIELTAFPREQPDEDDEDEENGDSEEGDGTDDSGEDDSDDADESDSDDEENGESGEGDGKDDSDDADEDDSDDDAADDKATSDS